MIARFDSECGLCFGDIDEGFTEIEYASDAGWIHKDRSVCGAYSEEYDDEEDDFAFGE